MMEAYDVCCKLTDAGYSFTEAHQILRYLRDEQEFPTSSQKGHRLAKAQAIVRGLGVSPDEIDFSESGEAYRHGT